jgi:hypothetical protein
MDISFYGDYGFYQINSIVIGTDSTTSSLYVNPIYTSSISISSTQNWRIMRRVPKDNYVLVQSMPSYNASGLLIPQNFNPNYDPYTLARKAGLVQ